MRFFKGLICAIGICLAFGVKASHTMGGDFTYKLLSVNGTTATYEITLKVFRDCNSNTALDNQIHIKVFYAHNNTQYLDLVTNLSTSRRVQPSCIDTNIVCIEEGIYKRNVNLTSSSASGFYGFNLTWARCCRNNAITNLTTNLGQLWTIFIPDHTYKNSSVQYLNVPVPFLCKGVKSTFNLNAYDPNGDSLVFRLVQPYRGGSMACATPNETGCSPGDLIPPYKTVTYKAGYSVAQPFGSGSSVTINPATGEITTFAVNNGNFVLAIEVEEFRKTSSGYVSMGKTRRDVQYVVRTCPANSAPFIDSAYSAGYDKQVEALKTLCFDIRAYDIESDSVFISRVGAIFDSTQGLPKPYATLPPGAGDVADTVRFCWTPSCAHVSESPYIITVFAEDDRCNSRQVTFSVKVLQKNTLNAPKMYCTNIKNDSTVQLTWKAPPDTTGLKFYRVYRKAATATTFILVDTVYANTLLVQYDDSSVTLANTKAFDYYVTAANPCGIEGTASDTLQTIQLAFNKLTPGKGNMVWNAPAAGTQKYYISKNTGSSYLDIDSTANLGYYLNTCITNTDYRVYIKQPGICNSISNPVNIWLTPGDSVPPAPPAMKAVSVTSPGNVQLQWAKSDSPYVKYYEIWRSVNGGSYSLQTTLEYDSAFQQNSLNTKNNLYSYFVVARDSCPSANQSAHSDTLTVIRHSGSSWACVPLVQLKWNKAKAVGQPILQYVVERVNGSGPFIGVKTLTASDTAWTDSSVTTLTSYCYRVKAISSTYSSYSDSFCIEPTVYPAPQPVQLAFVTVKQTGTTTGVDSVYWNRVPLSDTFARSYLLYHATDSMGPFSQIAAINNLNTTYFTGTGKNTESQRHFYQVKVKNMCNFISDSSERHGTMVLNTYGGNLTSSLSWDAYKGWPVNQYNIYRGTSLSSMALVTSVGGSTVNYTDTNVSCNNNYYYRIEAAGTQNGNPVVSRSNEDTATVYDIIPPLDTKMVRASVITSGLTSGQVQVEWMGSGEKNRSGYKIYRSEAGGPFLLAGSTSATATGINTFIDNGLNTALQTNTYKITVLDSCGNESGYSDVHTTSDITASPGFGEISVTWTPYVGFTNYEYILDRKLIGKPWTQAAKLPKDSLHFADKGTQCQTRYFYRVKTRNLDDTMVMALSDTTFTDAFDTIPPQQPYLVSTTLDNPVSATVTWATLPDPDVKEYILQRALRYTNSWQTIYTSPTDTFHTDNTLQNTKTQSYCYRMMATDLCNNVGKPGNVGCLVTLRGYSGYFQNVLAWDDYTYWPLGINQYQLYRSDNGQPFIPVASIPGSGLLHEDSLLSDTSSLFCYYVVAEENAGGYQATSKSNIVCLTQKASYYIPSAFTPGMSEGLNDAFGPVGSFISKVKMQIFDRWGQMVYETPNGERYWYGRKNNGDLLPEGVYLYHILIYSFDGTKTIQRGTVTMVR